MRAIIGGRLRERFVSPNGVETFRQFSSDSGEQPLEETYSTPQRELELKLTWSFGFRSETYRIKGQPVTRREYEERRSIFPDMPQSEGYQGIDEDSVVTIFRISPNARTEIFHPEPGMISHRTVCDGGAVLDTEMTYPNGRVSRKQFGVNGEVIFRSEKYISRPPFPDISIETRFAEGAVIAEEY